MRCGEKCFHVETEREGKKQTDPVYARTPAEARKTIRKVYGAHTPVLSVRQRKRHR